MSFKLGPKVLIVNDAAQAQLLFYSVFATGVKRLVETDDDYQTTTAFDDLEASPDTQSGAEGAGYLPATPSDDASISQAGMLRIAGFVDLEGADITSVVGSKGVTGAYQVSTITFSALTPVAGEEVTVYLDFQSSNLAGEFTSNQSDYKRKKAFTIVIATGETVTTLAAKLVAQINAITDAGWANWITATSAAGVVTLTSTSYEVTFTATFETDAVLTSAFATTTVGYEGRNTYTQLKALRIPTGERFGETFKSNQVPIAGAKYSSYLITKTVSRPDLAGQGGTLNDVPSGSFQYLIYVNETLTAYIANLTYWLNANAPNRTMYTATTAAAAVAAEAPAAVAAVDAAAPFTNPLV